MISTKQHVSTYFFTGKISDLSAEYQIQNMPIMDKYIFELFLNGIAIWGSTNKSFTEARREISDMFDGIISIFTLQTNKPVILSLDHWIETKEIDANKNIIGWFRPPFTPFKLRTVRSKINTPWKIAVKLYPKLHKTDQNYIIALKDYRLSMSNIGDDAFFYAYRAIEDICRAISGLSDTDCQAWKKMHLALGTDERMITPLKDVADEIRHGKANTNVIIQARQNRDKLLKIANDTIKLAFKKKFSLNLK